MGVGAVGVSDNFFELGAHSLHAMMIVSRVAETFAFRVWLREFFDSPTVTRMAEMIAAPDRVRYPNGAHAAGTSS